MCGCVGVWVCFLLDPPPFLFEGFEQLNPSCTCKKTQQSLKLTLERVLPYWNDTIVPTIKSGKRVVVAAHGNSIRAILKHLDNIPEDIITKIDVPTGVPLVYEFDADMKPIKQEGAAEHLSGR